MSGGVRLSPVSTRESCSRLAGAFLIRRRAIRSLYTLHGLNERFISSSRLKDLLRDVLIQDILNDIAYIEKALANPRFLKETGINIFGKEITKKQIRRINLQFLDTGTEKLIYKINLQLKGKAKPLVFVAASIRPNSSAHHGWESDIMHGADRDTIVTSHENWRGLIQLKNSAIPLLGAVMDFKIVNPVSTIESYMDHGDCGVGGRLIARRESEEMIYSYEFVEGKTVAQIIGDEAIAHTEREDIAVKTIYSALEIWLDTLNKDGIGLALLDPHPDNFVSRNNEPKSIDNERLVFGYTLEDYVRNVLQLMEQEELDPAILSKALLKFGEEALRRGISLAPNQELLEARRKRMMLRAIFDGEGRTEESFAGKRAFDINEAISHKSMAASIQAGRRIYESIHHAA